MNNFVPIFQQLTFLFALVAMVVVVASRIRRISANIQIGKALDRSDKPEERRKNMLLIAFGQKKMFDRPLVGFLHLAVYAGFLIINVEVLEIVLDGIFGTHRLFAPLLGILYPLFISIFELLALGVLSACVIFLLRRNFIKLKRFWSAEMTDFPRTDANIILTAEIVLMTALFTMNAADTVLQNRVDSQYVLDHYPKVGFFAVSVVLTPIFNLFETATLIVIERLAWWFHILGIFAFAIYVTYSKHLHIALAFPNTYFANLEAKGKFTNLESVTNEVKIAMGLLDESAVENAEVGRFGAKDVQDLTWKQLLDAYTCTECGRCTSVCPANQTGKLLSPRKIMMDTRDRLEEIGEQLSRKGADFDDGKALYGDYITKEEIMACTTCNACAEACPVNIDPLSIIVDIRRYITMEESDTPASWNMMFANTENNAAPWAFSPSDRFNWADELAKEQDKYLS